MGPEPSWRAPTILGLSIGKRLFEDAGNAFQPSAVFIAAFRVLREMDIHHNEDSALYVNDGDRNFRSCGMTAFIMRLQHDLRRAFRHGAPANVLDSVRDRRLFLMRP